ncbi:hypothetical protein, partial [Streptomyces sp. NPDC056670]|uniref:hypothetical protein n=1 Tax=Streptomyces sp. NPDC056670 TaxID=3345904 RepID=UPI0036BC4767
MATTTSYGTWNNHGDECNTTMRASILDAINGASSEWQERMEASGALDRIEADYDAAINEALPDGVSLNAGSYFLGPAYEADYSWGDGDAPDIKAIIRGIDLQEIIKRHDVDTNAVVKITYTSTLPTSREGIVSVCVEPFSYVGDGGQSPLEWAGEMLSSAGCSR